MLTKLSHSLKSIDLFKSSQALNMSRYNRHHKKHVSFKSMGSKVGGLFTILLFVCMSSLFAYFVQRMLNGMDDTI